MGVDKSERGKSFDVDLKVGNKSEIYLIITTLKLKQLIVDVDLMINNNKHKLFCQTTVVNLKEIEIKRYLSL